MTLTIPSAPLPLHAIEAGEPENPPLVVLHGLFGSSTNWRSIIKELARDFHIIAADLRNHGESPWSDSMQYRQMAADVAQLIDRYNLERPAIIGHSMGGKTAMAMAQLGLTQLDKLVIADIAPVPYSHTHEGFVNAMQAVDLARVKSRNEVESRLKETIQEAGIRQFLLQNLKRGENGYLWRINLTAIQSNMSDLLDYGIDQVSDIEALFIAGEKSNYIEPGMHQAIRHLFPNSQIQTINNTGHWLHAEQPARFIDIVKAFLIKPS
ncbi:MAG: alpha/beta fold hydrolase [Arenicellales bacterium]